MAVAAITSFWAVNALIAGNIFIPVAELSIIGKINIEMDFLSAVFILIINLITVSGSFYAIGYMKHYKNSPALNMNFISFNLLQLSMLMVCSMQNLFAFLIVWEIMSLSSFLLVIFEYEKKETIKAGLNYLIQMHVGVILLMIGFMWIYKETGALTFAAIGEYFETHSNLLLFFIFFIGFGLKAGFVPFHSWLPHAHPAAPSHVSGVMSGVMIKMGIYGLLRILSLIHSDFITIGIFILVVGI